MCQYQPCHRLFPLPPPFRGPQKHTRSPATSAGAAWEAFPRVVLVSAVGLHRESLGLEGTGVRLTSRGAVLTSQKHLRQRKQG